MTTVYGKSNRKSKRKQNRIAKQKNNIAEMNVEEFMAMSPASSESDLQEEEEDETMSEDTQSEKVCYDNHGRKRSHKMHLSQLAETDPEFYRFLKDNDEDLLQFSESDVDDEEETDKEEEDEVESDSSVQEEEEEEMEEEEEENVKRVTVTGAMVKEWSKKLKETQSEHALRAIVHALHSAVLSVVHKPGSEDQADDDMQFAVKDSSVFNSVMVACLRHVIPTLSRHIHFKKPPRKRLALPSSHSHWKALREPVRIHLQDVLQLLGGVAEPSMVCALLRHIDGLWTYYLCFPKLSRLMERRLVMIWGGGSDEARVLSFLILRRIVIASTHTKQERMEKLLKHMYLTFIRHGHHTVPSSMPSIQFMHNCLIEILPLLPDLSYQLIFVHIRQMASELQSAFRGKGKERVCCWPYIHSLGLFVAATCSPAFNLLVFPVTQVALGTMQLLSSNTYRPLQLRVVRMLMSLSEETDTFIPVAPQLITMLESSSGRVVGKSSTGKPPNLTCLLKLSKAQLGTRATQSTLLDSALRLLVQLLANSSHSISFPELSFPLTVRLRKVMKTTPLTWFKTHVKQLVEKVEEVSSVISRERSSLPFSPKDLDQISVWEQQRKLVPNALTRFWETWQKLQHQTYPHNDAAAVKKKTTEDKNEDDDDQKNKTKKTLKRVRQNDSREGKAKKTKTKQLNSDSDIEDTLEDLVLSD